MKRPQENRRRLALKTTFARELRRQMTEHERRLWSELRCRRFADMRFRRQQPIGPYIVDFYCAAANLIVELDGGQHFDPDRRAYDNARTRWLQDKGYRVLKFANFANSRERNSVLDVIWNALQTLPSP